MDLEKDIYCNCDKLIKNSKIKISYMGNLTKENPNKIYCHFGYGENWDNVQDIELQFINEYFQNEIILDGGDDVFNFCFHDGQGNWDNNDGKNYSFPIQEVEEIEDVKECEDVSHCLPLATIETSYLNRVKLVFNKFIQSLPNLLKGLKKSQT